MNGRFTQFGGILRLATSIKQGTVTASLMLKKLANSAELTVSGD
ncbi:Tn3 family transposase [Rouxiella silvae]|nr:Tn3 family transposase [Rouxiella silvae]